MPPHAAAAGALRGSQNQSYMLDSAQTPRPSHHAEALHHRNSPRVTARARLRSASSERWHRRARPCGGPSGFRTAAASSRAERRSEASAPQLGRACAACGSLACGLPYVCVRMLVHAMRAGAMSVRIDACVHSCIDVFVHACRRAHLHVLLVFLHVHVYGRVKSERVCV